MFCVLVVAVRCRHPRRRRRLRPFVSAFGVSFFFSFLLFFSSFLLLFFSSSFLPPERLVEKDNFYNTHVHIICGQSLNPILLEDDMVMCGVDTAAAIFVMTDKTSVQPEVMDADTM